MDFDLSSKLISVTHSYNKHSYVWQLCYTLYHAPQLNQAQEDFINGIIASLYPISAKTDPHIGPLGPATVTKMPDVKEEKNYFTHIWHIAYSVGGSE